MSDVLIIKHLTKCFKSGENIVKAVDDVSFNVEEGEFVAILGPSGSGKTTLLSMIGGIVKPSSGKIFFENTDLTTIKDKQRARLRLQKIGFVFQSHNLIPHLNAFQNLLLAAEIDRGVTAEAKHRAKSLLAELKLEKRIYNLPSQLSGGERQRVAIGRALMNDPLLILVDEPTASLDTERGEEVVKSIAEQIKDKRKAGIMVTHDIRMCRYVDRVIHIVDGKLHTQSDKSYGIL